MTDFEKVEGTRVGAYGIAVTGLADQDDALVGAAPHWPTVRILSYRGPPQRPAPSINQSRAVFPDGEDGYAIVDGVSGTATFTGPRPPESDELLHPRLGMVGAVYAQWLGREAFHAGAFIHRDLAWAVVGDGHAGKSSLLAALYAAGTPVVCDDTLVVSGGMCVSGPRCIDLRGAASERLGIQDCDLSVRRGGRLRLRLGPASRSAPLAGWVFLRWGEDYALEPIPAADRVVRIGERRGWHRRGVNEPRRLLELASLPAWELRRPPDWRLMPETVQMLHATLDAVRQPRCLEQQASSGIG